MIARTWSARAAPANAPAYAEHLRAHVLPELRRIGGYRGALLMQHDADGLVEITVLTLWESLDAVRAFAGDDAETAVVADEAVVLRADFDMRVRHAEVPVADGI